MKRIILILGMVMMGLFIMAGLASAEIPYLINYQGRLTDTTTGNPLVGTYSVTFRIYDELGNELWKETHTVDLEEKDCGLFEVLLGEIKDLTTDIFEGKYRILGIEIDDEELFPKQRIACVGYAYMADEIKGPATTDNIFASSGNVGIGTTDPGGYKLKIVGDTPLYLDPSGDEYLIYDADGRLSVYNSESSTGEVRVGAAWNKPGLYSSGPLYLFSHTTGVYIGDSNSEKMFVRSDGNVGIGTRSPGEKLDVAGNIKVGGGIGGVSGQFIQFPSTSNDWLKIWGEHDGGDTTNLVIATGDNPNDGIKFRNYEWTGTVREWFYSSPQKTWFGYGDVGIGVTDPRQRLDVNGSINIRSNFNLYVGDHDNDGGPYIKNYSIGNWEGISIHNLHDPTGSHGILGLFSGWDVANPYHKCHHFSTDGRWFFSSNLDDTDETWMGHRHGTHENEVTFHTISPPTPGAFFWRFGDRDLMYLYNNGNLYIDGSYYTFSSKIDKENPTAKDYLDWALEDAKKPCKPYDGIYSNDEEGLQQELDIIEAEIEKLDNKLANGELGEEERNGKEEYKTQLLEEKEEKEKELEDAIQFKAIANECGVESKEDEIEKYGKDIPKIAVGTCLWAEEAEKRLSRLEKKVKGTGNIDLNADDHSVISKLLTAIEELKAENEVLKEKIEVLEAKIE